MKQKYILLFIQGVHKINFPKFYGSVTFLICDLELFFLTEVDIKPISEFRHSLDIIKPFLKSKDSFFYCDTLYIYLYQ